MSSRFSRWNIEQGSGDEILVCTNDHEKGCPCEYRRIQFSEVKAMQKRITELENLQQSGEPVGYIVPIAGYYKFFDSHADAQEKRNSEEYWDKDLDHVDPKPVYITPQPVVPEGYALVTLNDLKTLQFYLEPYDDIKPRDWVTDRRNLRIAHQLLQALLSAGKGGEPT